MKKSLLYETERKKGGKGRHLADEVEEGNDFSGFEKEVAFQGIDCHIV